MSRYFTKSIHQFRKNYCFPPVPPLEACRLLYSASSEGEHIISGTSVLTGINFIGSLSRANHGREYTFGSSNGHTEFHAIVIDAMIDFLNTHVLTVRTAGIVQPGPCVRPVRLDHEGGIVPPFPD